MEELPIRFAVGDLRVDLGLQRVSRNGEPVPLPKLSFDLLIALARAAPNLISVDQLMTLVWPGLVVNPETVSKRVELLREALGDEPRAPRYIESLRGRGYRLIQSVVSESALPPLPPTDVGIPKDPKHRSDAPAEGLTTLPALGTAAGLWSSKRWIAMWTALVVAAAFAGWAIHTRQADAPAVEPASAHSIAVMPFEDLSVTHDNGQLALALPEMVLQRLGTLKDLVVIARSSSFSFTGKQVDAREIGRQLNVHYLVEGALQRQGDDLRVTVQLIDAPSRRELQTWQFDRPANSIFELQDQIAASLATALQVTLLQADTKLIDRSRASSLGAYLSYLHSQELLNRWTVGDTEQAIRELEDTARTEPTFALAYAELARAYWLRSFLERGKNYREDTPRLRAFVDRALALDPNLGEAYAMRGQLRLSSDPTEAESDFRKGIELAPNYGPGYVAYAEALRDELRRPEEGLAMIERAISIDPVAPRDIYLKGLYEWWDLHDVARAERSFVRAIEVGPEFPPAYARLAELRWERGQVAEAVKLVEDALRFEKQAHFINDEACALYLDIGDRHAAADLAAASPQDSDMKLLIAAYDGDFRSVSTDTGAYTFSFHMAEDAYWVARLRNVSDGMIDISIATLRHQLGFQGGGEGFVLDQQADWREAIGLAYLLKVRNQRVAATNLLSAFRRFLDSQPGIPRHAYARAQILSGDLEGAFANLSEELKPAHWSNWWLFKRQPLMDAVRSDPRYLALADLENNRMAEQRKLLAVMRESGEVPRREELH